MATKTYYLVRHAEKQDPADPDTPISVIGKKRANALKNTLQAKNIKNIIVSQFIRTQQTAKPLEEAIHIAHTVINKDDVSAVVTRLENFTNSLIVGHTDNVPAIIKIITGQTVTIAEDDFDNLFIITVTQFIFFTRKKLTRTTYGQPSP